MAEKDDLKKKGPPSNSSDDSEAKEHKLKGEKNQDAQPSNEGENEENSLPQDLTPEEVDAFNKGQLAEANSETQDQESHPEIQEALHEGFPSEEVEEQAEGQEPGPSSANPEDLSAEEAMAYGDVPHEYLSDEEKQVLLAQHQKAMSKGQAQPGQPGGDEQVQGQEVGPDGQPLGPTEHPQEEEEANSQASQGYDIAADSQGQQNPQDPFAQVGMPGVGAQIDWFREAAYNKFMQAAPELTHTILAFNDLSEELPDESGVKVGVFVLQSGPEVIFAPVVAKAKSIYPIDSVFLDSRKKFLPLTKHTVNLILNMNAISLGTTEKIPGSVVKNPSVFELINPPKTGKFMYASSSRLIEFLASMPNHLKSSVFEKFIADQEVYKGLHKLFGLEALAEALRPTLNTDVKVEAKPSVAIFVTGDKLSKEDIRTVLTEGYVVKGQVSAPRTAIATQRFEDNQYQQVNGFDVPASAKVYTEACGFIEAYFAPRRFNSVEEREIKKTMAILPNGDYVIAESFTIQGEPQYSTEHVLNSIRNTFISRPPILPRAAMEDTSIAFIDADCRCMAAIEVHKVEHTGLGSEITGRCLFSGSRIKVIASDAIKAEYLNQGKTIYIRSNAVTINLAREVRSPFTNVNQLYDREFVRNSMLLPERMNISFDGVSFCVNGKLAGDSGSEVDLARHLILKEHVPVDTAKTFIKQAKVQKHVTLLMSKSAEHMGFGDYTPGDIPEFGQDPSTFDADNDMGQRFNQANNAALVPNVQSAMQLNDAQTVEATILSQLLQTSDMVEDIEEYLPDIEEGIDKLGRILFMSRVHISKLSENMDADAVFGFLSNLRNVYRTLGDTYSRLCNMVSTNQTSMVM